MVDVLVTEFRSAGGTVSGDVASTKLKSPP